MPKIITEYEPLSHLFLGHEDSSELDESLQLIAERVVDITDICDEVTTGIGQVVLKYARARRGMVVQLQKRTELGVDSGMSIILPSPLNPIEEIASIDWFVHRARVLGCSPVELARTFVGFVPFEDLEI